MLAVDWLLVHILFVQIASLYVFAFLMRTNKIDMFERLFMRHPVSGPFLGVNKMKLR